MFELDLAVADLARSRAHRRRRGVAGARQGRPDRGGRAARLRARRGGRSSSRTTAAASSTASPPPLDVLPEVVDAVDGRVEVLVDGGIRRGTDVVKALALGARGGARRSRAALGPRRRRRGGRARRAADPAGGDLERAAAARLPPRPPTSAAIGWPAHYPERVKTRRCPARRRPLPSLLAFAHDRPRADAASCAACPPTAPLWVDYAGHDAPIVPKPGMVLAVSSGTVVPAQMRAAGAATIFFDLHLNDRVGTTRRAGRPGDDRRQGEEAVRLRRPGDRLRDAADRRERALRRSDADSVERDERAVPRERARAAAGARRRSARRPAITIANPPYTGGDAADWWREAAQAAILIRQVYFTSPGPKGLIALGPARASRSMRKGMRGLVARFGAIGIPAGRVALELQFQSAPGQGGRQGLQPTSAWLEFVKLEALAAKQVADDTQDRRRLVVGLAELLGRRQRSGQARRGLRLSVDARPEALRRARRRRRRLQHVAHRGPDRAAGRASAARSARSGSRRTTSAGPRR